MKIQFHVRGLKVSAGLRYRLEQALEGLQGLISIRDAAVVLEYERDNAPAFRVYVLLAVTGPDIHAEGRDHTLEASWLKVIAGLHKQIEQRKSRQRARFEAARQDRNQSRMKRAFPRLYNGVICPTYNTAHSFG